MYKIYADGALIYDSTLEDYKIGKGEVTREADKSGSFVFSLYPDHPYYDSLVKLKTVVTVSKSDRIVFRGRVLDDAVDYWNNKVFTCEGELGFLRDSVARPFSFSGTPAALFSQLIEGHNAQVDDFKKFKIGSVTVVDPNGYIARSNTDYETTLENLNSRLLEDATGGHLYITHDGEDEIPTIHYVADFPKTATQAIEFGKNLKDYAKKANAAAVATAVVPLGVQAEDGTRLTIAAVNGGVDYIYDADAVAERGWIFKTVIFDDVTLEQNLKAKGEAWLANALHVPESIELTAIDLHLLDRSIESFNVCEYVPVVSEPHGLNVVMLCTKQTMNLLAPQNDTVVLGYQSKAITDTSSKVAGSIVNLDKKVTAIKRNTDSVEILVHDLEKGVGQTLKVGADGVTITNAAGEAVTINGGQIDATYLSVYAANIIGTLVAEVLQGSVIQVRNAYGQVTATITPGATTGAGFDLSTDGNLYLYGGGSMMLNSGGNIVVACGGGAFHPTGAAPNLGDPTLGIWNAVYASTGTIQTSDKNRKHDIEDLPEKYVAMLDAILPKRFKLDSGTSGRYHVGFIAQDVEAAMAENGIDSKEFAGWVKDQDAEGKDIYMLRYDEFIALLHAKIRQLESRLAEVEVDK